MILRLDNFSYRDLVPALQASVDYDKPVIVCTRDLSDILLRFPNRCAFVLDSSLLQTFMSDPLLFGVWEPAFRHADVMNGRLGSIYGTLVFTDAYVPPDQDVFRMPRDTMMVVSSNEKGELSSTTLRTSTKPPVTAKSFDAAPFLATPAERAAYLNEFIGDDALFTSALIDCINSAPDLCISTDEPEQIMTAVDLTSVQQFLQKLGLTLQIVPTLIHSEIRE